MITAVVPQVVYSNAGWRGALSCPIQASIFGPMNEYLLAHIEYACWLPIWRITQDTFLFGKRIGL